MPAEQFVINIITTGDKEAVAAQGRVAASSREMGVAAKGASTASASAAATSAQSWSNAGNTATAAGKKLNRGITLPVLAISAVTGKLAVDFEKSMRNVNSIAQLPEPTFQRLNNQVLQMAGRTAQAPITLSEGLYDLVSSGFKAGEAITVLEASAHAATAGLTTTEVSTKAVAAALNAYHLPAAKAKAISDDLFQTVNLGVITFDELASTIGYVLPAASTMGVDIKQVGASISTLTKEGQSGANAVTNINAALTAFIKPSKDMKHVLHELGYETSKQLIAQKGFQGALELVTRAVGGGEEAIGKLFPNVRAMRAVFGLTGASAKQAGKDVRGFQEDTGATAKVLHEQQKSLAFQWNELKAEGAELGIEIGKKLIPSFRSLAGDAAHVVHWFTELPEGVQSTTIKVLAFGAALGPILRIGGAFATVIGGIYKGFAALAGMNLVGEITAALAIKGERMAALSMVGADMAPSIMGGLAKAIPVAAAGAGVINILSSVLSGDSKGALEKTGGAIGGAIIGGIAGSVIPGIGTVMGAAVGGGAGSFLGPIIGDLFDSEKKITPMQARLAASSKGLAGAMRDERQAAQGLVSSSKGLVDAKHRHRAATRSVEQAEHRLTEVLKSHKHNTMPVLRAELELARAKHRNAKASDEVKAAERLQGYERKLQMPIMRTSILEARHRINVLKDERQALRRSAKEMVENGSTEKERVRWMREARKNSTDLAKAEKNKNEILADANRLIGPAFAKNLQHATREQLKLVTQVQGAGKTVKQHYEEMSIAVFGFSRSAESRLAKVRGSYEKTKGVLGPFRTEASRQMSKATGDVWGFARGTQKAFGLVETETNTALTGLGVKQVNFGITTPQKKAQGGLVKIPGAGNQDTVPLNVMGQPVVAAPGEDIAFITQHQRADLDYAVKHIYGDSGLTDFFKRQNRPHYMARGGIVEPRMSGPDPMQDAGQNAIHAVTKAAIAYVRKQGGDKSYKAIVDNGNRMDGLAQPYLWGGGHGSMPSRNGPWDCSGGTTELFYGAGWKELRPMVSSGFSGFGSPGKGKVSILSNAEHVYTVVGNRAIGTSGENPGGGFGWINGYTYRPGFNITHVDLMGEGAEGIPTSARAGKGQKPAKGFARGGLVVKGKVSWFSGGATAGGSSTSHPGLALNLHPGTEAGWNNSTTQGWMKQSQAGHPVIGDTVIAGHHAHLPIIDLGPAASTGRAIDVTEGGVSALGFTTSNFPTDAQGTVTVGSATGTTGTTEQVPAVFHGAQTGNINFPSVPKNLKGVERKIGEWQAKLSTYRRAVKAAKGKPKLAAALEKNVKAIEGWLTQLRRQRALLRRKAAMKKVSKRLRRKLGRITGAERSMEEAERVYTIADQTAGQVVGLEPQAPEYGEDVDQATREAGERKYVQTFKDYVEGQERPAYAQVLDALANWRNITIGGEQAAGHLETGWEKEVRQVDGEMAQINAFTEKVSKDKATWKAKHPKADFPDWIKDEIKKDHQNRARLPVLRFRDREVRKTLGEAREAFYPGRKNPVQPPAPPMPGSGSIEDVLAGIQGTHWPDQHSKLPASSLGPPRRPGVFGGSIWDAQTAIEELGLKVNQVANAGGAAGAGGPSQGEQERLELLEQENARLKRENLVHLAQAPVLANYLGAYEKGGILPDTGFYLGHKGEQVVPADQVGQAGVVVVEPHVYLEGDLSALDGMVDARVEVRLREVGRNVNLSRGTPSVPGRRAVMHQGQRSS